MSGRNGDKARFNRYRRRKLAKRQRVRAFFSARDAADRPAPAAASVVERPARSRVEGPALSAVEGPAPKPVAAPATAAKPRRSPAVEAKPKRAKAEGANARGKR